MGADRRDDEAVLSFAHEPLESEDHIRLIRLLPGPRDVVSIAIEHADLRFNRPDYYALSYTWGPSSPSFDILCGGRVINIRENLYRFLQLLNAQASQRDSLFWVDQISIDQENVLEKNHQVTLMAKIYRQACGITAWLGEEDSSTRIAALYFDRDKNAWDDWDEVKGRKSTYDLAYSGVSRWKVHPSRDEWFAIIELFRRSYWSRLWIVQELLAGPPVDIRCGDVHIASDSLFSFLKYRHLAFGHKENHILLPNEEKIRTYTMILNNPTSHVKGQLFTILAIFHDNDCTDPRDKLYGVMSLLDIPEGEIVVDYSKSVKEVFFDVAQYWCGRLKVSWIDAKDILPLASVCHSMLPDLLPEENVEHFKGWLLEQTKGLVWDASNTWLRNRAKEYIDWNTMEIAIKDVLNAVDEWNRHSKDLID